MVIRTVSQGFISCPEPSETQHFFHPVLLKAGRTKFILFADDLVKHGMTGAGNSSFTDSFVIDLTEDD